MLVYLRGTPTWRAEDSINIWNLLWLSSPLIIWTDHAKIWTSTFPNTVTSKKAKKTRDKCIFFSVHVHNFKSRTAITLKFKMCLFLDKASYWAEKLLTDINLPHLMPDVDNNFGGSLGLDFRKWWRHVQPKNWKSLAKMYAQAYVTWELQTTTTTNLNYSQFSVIRPINNCNIPVRLSTQRILYSF